MPNVQFADVQPTVHRTAAGQGAQAGRRLSRRSRGSEAWAARPPPLFETLDPAAEAAANAKVVRERWAQEYEDACPMASTWLARVRRRKAGGKDNGPLRRCPAALRDRQAWAARFGITGGVQTIVTAETPARPAAAAARAEAARRYVSGFRRWWAAEGKDTDPEPSWERPPRPEPGASSLRDDSLAEDCRQRSAVLQDWLVKANAWANAAPQPPPVALRSAPLLRCLSRDSGRPLQHRGVPPLPAATLPPDLALALNEARARWEGHEALPAAGPGPQQARPRTQSCRALPLSARQHSSELPAAPLRERPQSSGPKRAAELAAKASCPFGALGAGLARS
eukprot:TRINITY_DN21527_c0_g1_i1.p1 TRINITY_DN21527_c0_g1~~TRINITY_DN21527_c0_g1_i1.p1  ORF type:complete len:365 (+),score=70.03 TRINITY_DN21527_c0_g1_i1:82-1095(+)